MNASEIENTIICTLRILTQNIFLQIFFWRVYINTTIFKYTDNLIPPELHKIYKLGKHLQLWLCFINTHTGGLVWLSVSSPLFLFLVVSDDCGFS